MTKPLKKRKEIRPRLKFTKDLLEPLVKASTNFSDLARMLKYPEYSVGGASGRLSKKVRQFGIDYSHFSKKLSGAVLGKSDNEVFIKGITYFYATHRKRLLKLRGEKCERCGLHEWLGEPIALDVHHLNEDRKDNRLENLKLVCPNCHRSFHSKE